MSTMFYSLNLVDDKRKVLTVIIVIFLNPIWNENKFSDNSFKMPPLPTDTPPASPIIQIR